ncbi:hypothetical protein Hanom_Chr14g01332341 [Helianthus anomalus]
MRKNKPLDESCKTDQTPGTKMALYSNLKKPKTYSRTSGSKKSNLRTRTYPKY